MWVARHVCSLCREWGKTAIVVKLDLRRAFDSVDRRALASKIEEWMAAAFPQEAACFVAMLSTNDLQVILPWGDQVDISSGVGVKQGSTESPSLFSRLMDDILVEVRRLQGGTLFDDLHDSTAAFMGDVLGWFPDAAALDTFFRALLPRLAAFGLKLQPAKCQMMLLGGIADPELVLEGVLPCQEMNPCMLCICRCTPQSLTWTPRFSSWTRRGLNSTLCCRCSRRGRLCAGDFNSLTKQW